MRARKPAKCHYVRRKTAPKFSIAPASRGTRPFFRLDVGTRVLNSWYKSYVKTALVIMFEFRWPLVCWKSTFLEMDSISSTEIPYILHKIFVSTPQHTPFSLRFLTFIASTPSFFWIIDITHPFSIAILHQTPPPKQHSLYHHNDIQTNKQNDGH